MATPRTFGTPDTLPRRQLVPIPGEVWLQAKVWTPGLTWAVVGALSTFLLSVLILLPFHNPPVALFLTLVGLCLGAGMLLFIVPFVFLALLLDRRTRQYCPDCLQYMMRGARVCPFCGFREEPAPAAVPAAPSGLRPRRSA
jgi:hypothetical protein